MPITCPNCEYDRNPNNATYCEVCGAELKPTTPATPPTINTSTSPHSYPDTPLYTDDYRFTPPPDYPDTPPHIDSYPPNLQENYPDFNLVPTPSNIAPTVIQASSASLIPKLAGSPVPEFILDGGSALIGRFDTETGPVDVDLERFVGEETVSRHHAEIYREGGEWKIKDIGSTNGVFIKRSGQTRFGSRITIPESLYPGDEIAIGKIRLLFQIS